MRGTCSRVYSASFLFRPKLLNIIDCFVFCGESSNLAVHVFGWLFSCCFVVIGLSCIWISTSSIPSATHASCILILNVSLHIPHCSFVQSGEIPRLCSVGYAQKRTRGVYTGITRTRNFCGFGETLISHPYPTIV